MKKALPKQKRSRSLAECTQKTLLPLVAVGGSLAVAPASAIELGEATVQSRLGQPLRASIAFALAPSEQLSESCISLGAGQSGLPGIGRATISIVDGALLLRSSAPVREPLVAANVVINCPFAARLNREYMMFIDPAGAAADATPVTTAAPAAQPAATTRPAAAAPVTVPPSATQAAPASTRPNASASETAVAPPVRRTPPAGSRQPIGQSTRYRVQPGDSLSEITQRIENRRMRLWPAVDVLFKANPDAFIDNDPNKLKAGSWLTIPSFDGSKPVVAAAPAARPPATAVAPLPEVVAPDVVPDVVPAATAEPESTVGTGWEALPDTGNAATPVDDATVDLRPGAVDQIPDASIEQVPVAASETIAIPDTAIPAPQTTSSAPNVTTATVQPRTDERTSSWLWWLAGSGAAIILALLLFGRTLRSRFGSTPFDVANELPIAGNAAEDDAIAVKAAVDYDIADDEPTAENPTLDADLIMGTGLDVDIGAGATADIGDPSPTAIDIELPFGSDADAAARIEKTMQSASARAEETILDSEILPESDDYPDADDFDMSVVLDATKMPGPDTVTESVDAASADDELLDPTVEEQTVVASEHDLDILQQDYEDEFSATMAMKMELTQAAENLVKGMEANATDDSDEFSIDGDSTTTMSLGSLSDYDVKNHAAAENDEEAVTQTDLEELTLEIFSEDDTAEMPLVDDEKTRKMPGRGVKLDKKAG